MSKVEFQLTYDGPALSEHGMDVADLAPSLLALADIAKRANYLLNKNATTINVVVQSNFERGSFKINLELIQSAVEKLREFFDSDLATTAKDIAGLIGFLGTAGFGLLKYLAIRKGREVETVIKSKDETGVVSVKFKGDNNTINVNNNVYILGEDPDIRRDAARVVAPLNKEGIERLELGTPRKPRNEEITKIEARAITTTYEQLGSV